MSGEIRFRLATAEDLPVVRTLWQEGFPEDTAEAVDAFWRAVYGIGRCLFCEQAGTAVSMVFLLPAEAHVAEKRIPIWYVYAATTRRSRRGEGFFRRLLNEAAARAVAENVAALFLRPGEPSLFAYYARCGFLPVVQATVFECEVDKLYTNAPTLLLKNVERGYAHIRNAALERLKIPHVVWPDDVADLAVEMAKKAHGNAVFGDWGAALYERDGDTLLVRELLCAPERRKQVLFSMASCIPCHTVVANCPALGGRGDIFGMLRPCAASAPSVPLYMGLTLE